MIKKLFNKYKDIIFYGIFGVLTTAVNLIVYKLTYGVMKIPNVPSTCIAWFFAVAFAFITNKLWVFNSNSFEMKVLLKEACGFFSARILTGILEVGIMWLAVDKWKYNPDLCKLSSNIIVIIINYIASKFIIFKKN